MIVIPPGETLPAFRIDYWCPLGKQIARKDSWIRLLTNVTTFEYPIFLYTGKLRVIVEFVEKLV